MCGRYRLSRKDRFAQYFEVDPFENFEPRYNIAPTQPVTVVRRAGNARDLATMRWGLIPSWSQDASIGASLINARSETVLEKPAFRDSFRSRRCLIPANGFYEWKRAGKSKQPYHFGLNDDELFAFAGLWDRWRGPEGKTVESCSILTTTPNELLSDVHDRMPVILSQMHYEAWLMAPVSEGERLQELLVPIEAERMRCYPVSAMVNAAQNESPECARQIEVGPDQRSSGFLFDL
jgi:putative SOS response-associated peptidase YedK